MASSREERLQMRQRGAGTRKIQAVDFGFSFGSPPPASQSALGGQTDQSAPEGTTNGIDSVVADAGLTNATSSVNNEGPTEKTPTRTTATASKPIVQSPLRSAANSNNRTSIFNSTLGEQEEGRSSKRRRISTENDALTPTSASKLAPVARTSLSIQEDDPQINSPQNDIADAETAPKLATDTATAATEEIRDSDVQVEHEADPSEEVVRTKRRERAKTVGSQQSSNTKADEADERTKNRPTRRQSAVNGSDPPHEDVHNEEERSRPSNRKRRQNLEEQQSEESGQDNGHENAAPPAPKPSKRKQKQKDAKVDEREQEEEEEDNELTQQASRGSRKSLGRPSRNIEPEREENQEESNKRKRKGKQKATDTAGGDEEQDQVEVAQSSEESRTRKKQRQSLEGGVGTRRRGRQPLETRQQEPRSEAEAADNHPETKPGTNNQPEQPAKRRRGKPSGIPDDRNETTNRQARTGRRGAPDGAEERDKRQGGTVSITVHRLANAEILDSLPADADSSSDNERDASDEQQSEAAAGKRFPSRAGVNAADVLAQICKEILDKQITSLTENITNDTTTQSKRSEYTRQCKAVEEYGAQLEGRLFELSELLDSNFTLGVQLKRAKREAAEMRNRLLAVRQRRHEITLRMDAVRRKHGEEENAKMSRNAINNALHNLEMTLDRNRIRPEADGSGENGKSEGTGIAGLEFLLRSVSENVSSAAEGSQGGLLSQVKAFNAQLEKAAKKLERP